MATRKTKEQVVIEAKKVHGNKYDYSKFEYTRSHDKGLFICPTHGEFNQVVKDHLAGRGCWGCSGSKKYSQKEWINSAKKVHKNKYDYSKVKYQNSKSKVTIVCPKHGEFEQGPASHMYGIGCAACAGLKKYTTETFIEKVNQVHNHKYSYTKTHINGIKSNVIITCSQHGDFTQMADSHMRGSGCPSCAGTKTLTFEEWLFQAKKKHNDKYNYSLVKFLNMNSSIIIICPIHGEVEQIPKQHIRSTGCRHCKPSVITTPIWIEKARKVHGNKFDYSMVEYMNNNSKVTIICPEHGETQQTPKQHINTLGCRFCNHKFVTTPIWIEKARKVHGSKFDYSKVEYKNSLSKVTITCPDHGDFQQVAVTHTQGHDCPMCKDTTMDTKCFIEKSEKVHGNLYDYSLVKYVNRTTQVSIVCPTHGKFKQIPHAHYGNKSGCPDCQENGFDPKSPGYLYYFKIKNRELYKVGITNLGIKGRFYKRDRDLIEKIYVEKCYEQGADAHKREQLILKEFSDFLYKGDDVLDSGNTELFTKDVIGCSIDENAFSLWEKKFEAIN